MPTPTDGEVLLPPLVSRHRPRKGSYKIFRNGPINLDVTLFRNLISQGLRPNLTNVTVQARVFRDFSDPGSLISTKTVENQGIVFVNETEAKRGQFQIALTLQDLAEPRPIFIAIYLDGAMVDLFGNEVHDSPL